MSLFRQQTPYTPGKQLQDILDKIKTLDARGGGQGAGGAFTIISPGGGGLGGSGTVNHLSRFVAPSTLGDAGPVDDGVSVRFPYLIGLANNKGVYWKDTTTALDRAGMVFNAANNLAISASKLASNTSMIQFLDNPGGNVFLQFLNNSPSPFMSFPLGVDTVQPAMYIQARGSSPNAFFGIDLDQGVGLFWRHGTTQKTGGYAWVDSSGVLHLSGIVNGSQGSVYIDNGMGNSGYIAQFGYNTIVLMRPVTIGNGGLTFLSNVGTITAPSAFSFYAGGVDKLDIGGFIQANSDLQPGTDNTRYCGTASFRWSHIYGSIINSGSSHLYLGTSSGPTYQIQAQTDLVPGSDNQWNCGTGSQRWKLVRAVTVTQGDSGYEERNCRLCGHELKVGDRLGSVVKGVKDNITLTVPVHLHCPRTPRRHHKRSKKRTRR